MSPPPRVPSRATRSRPPSASAGRWRRSTSNASPRRVSSTPPPHPPPDAPAPAPAPPPGRPGPGAGPPAKLSRRGRVEVAVSVPDRRYETLAGVLAGAIEPGTRETATNAGDVLDTEGFELGRSLVDGALAGRPRPRSRAARRELALDALESGGYAPGQGDAVAPDRAGRAATGDTILLANCPYDAVARAHRDVVCRMNVSVVRGVADGAGLPDDGIALVPADGRCCVIWSER